MNEEKPKKSFQATLWSSTRDPSVAPHPSQQHSPLLSFVEQAINKLFTTTYNMRHCARSEYNYHIYTKTGLLLDRICCLRLL